MLYLADSVWQFPALERQYGYCLFFRDHQNQCFGLKIEANQPILMSSYNYDALEYAIRGLKSNPYIKELTNPSDFRIHYDHKSGQVSVIQFVPDNQNTKKIW